jgi:hypothetical protein
MCLQKVDIALREILCDDAFIGTASAVIHNTVYNLLQEASFGEFAIQADPLKFVPKRDNMQ